MAFVFEDAPEQDYLTQLVPDAPVMAKKPRFVFDDEPQQQHSQVGIGRTALDQSLQGATFGFADEVTDRIGALGATSYSKIGKLFGADVPDINYSDALNEARDSSKQRMDAEFEQNPATAIASNIAGALLTGGALTAPKALSGAKAATGIRGAINAVPEAGTAFTNSLRTGGTLARVGKGAAAGAASGGLFGAGSAEEGNRLEGAGTGAVLGGVLGGAIPAIGGAVSGVKNSILPHVDDQVRELADKAVNTYGIPLKRSQIGDSRAAKVFASTAEKVPLSGAASFDKKVYKSFNRAVLKTIGEEGDKVTPEIINSAYKNIGKRFDDVLKGQTIKVSDDVFNRLANIESDARSSITGDNARIVQTQISKLLADVAEDGTIAGEKIGSFRSQLTKTLQRVRNDATPFLKDLQDLVVDASVDGSPQKRELLNTARLQYKNLKTIEPLAAKAIRGNIQPSLLLSRVATKFGDFSRGGGGELGDLARIGQTFLKDTIPNSGTPERLAAYGVLGGGALASLPVAAKAVAGAATFNALNSSQKLVKGAIKNTSKRLPKTTGVLPAIMEGQLATRP